MRPVMIAAALAGMALASGGSARSQEWGGVAGIAAARGYTASPGVRMTSDDAAPSPGPADVKALLASPRAVAPDPTVVDDAGRTGRHWRGVPARAKPAHRRRRLPKA